MPVSQTNTTETDNLDNLSLKLSYLVIKAYGELTKPPITKPYSGAVTLSMSDVRVSCPLGPSVTSSIKYIWGLIVRILGCLVDLALL